MTLKTCRAEKANGNTSNINYNGENYEEIIR